MFLFGRCAENNFLASKCAAQKYKELIFRLSLAPHTFSNVEVAAPAPIRSAGPNVLSGRLAASSQITRGSSMP